MKTNLNLNLIRQFIAIRNGNENYIQELIETKGIPVDSKWSDYFLLRYALRQGQKEIAKLLIDKGCRINKTTSPFITPLHIAVKQEYVEIVNILLAKGASVECKDHNGWTPLHFAIKAKNDEIIDLILTKISNTKNVNFISRAGLIPLHIACMRSDSDHVLNLLQSNESIKECINKPVDSTSPFWPSYTPLHFAVEFERTNTVQLLLYYGADICVKDSKDLTPLHLAVQTKNLYIIDLILAAHEKLYQNINPENSKGFSHFHAACMRNNARVVDSFLKHGIEINSTVNADSSDWPGYSSLHFAVEFDCLETVELLLSYNVDITLKNGRGLTPLHIAVQKNNQNIANLILRHSNIYCKNINPIDFTTFSHSNLSCKNLNNDSNIVKAFSRNKVKVNNPVNFHSTDWPGYTPLHFAVENRCEETVKLLLSYGADVHAMDAFSLTPLHLAILYPNVNIARMLLSNGADVNFSNGKGFTPLHVAVEKGYSELIEIFLKNNADINCIEPVKLSTPLHLATFYKHFKIINLLLKSGADTNAREKDGKTALHTMVLRNVERDSEAESFILEPLDIELMESYSKIIKLLVESGCDIDCKDKYGRTALHTTCLYGNLTAAYALLQHGADINIEDNYGNTPLLYCKREFHNIYYILQDHIEKLRNINFYVSDKNKKIKPYYKIRPTRRWLINRAKYVAEFSWRCNDELNRMKRTKINNSSSLYNIIFKNANEMAVYVKNENFKQIVKSSDFDKTFSLYGYLIRLQFEKGLAREVLMRPAKDSLEFLIGLGLPDPCSETIFKYLANEHLNELIKAKQLVRAILIKTKRLIVANL